jgi:hypothetical protein
MAGISGALDDIRCGAARAAAGGGTERGGDMRPGAPPVAMISAKFWSSELDARPGVLGQTAVALKRGMTPQAAQADLSSAASKHFGVHLTPLHGYLTGNLRDLPWMLIAAGGFILLQACANVAGGGRGALGAGRREGRDHRGRGFSVPVLRQCRA